MIKAVIKTNGVTTHEASHASQADAEAWVAEHQAMDSFPGGHSVSYEDASSEAQKLEFIRLGNADRDKCQIALDYVAGSNRSKGLTIAQITEMQALYSTAESALRASRPDLAAQVIGAMVPDGVLLTESEKLAVLSILSV